MSTRPRDLFSPTVEPTMPSNLRGQPALGDDAELVQRVAIVQIKEILAQAVEYQQNLWDLRDKDFAQSMGRKFERIVIDVPTDDNFYTGPRPSLVESPIEFWPSITARCNNSKPSQEGQLDQVDVIDLDLYIEVLCKAGPVPQTELHEQKGIETEGVVDAQGQRLTAAVQSCISVDKTLGGVVQRISRPATIKPSKPFARPSTPKGSNDYYVFYGKQLNYIVTKYQI